MNDQVDAPGIHRLILYVVGGLILLIGLILGGGGTYLLTLGGSAYFLLMGLAMVVAGFMIIKRQPLGAWIYAAALVLTAIWAVWDAGWAFWPLVSRVLTFSVIGLVVALIYPSLLQASGRSRSRGAYGIACLLGLGVAATLGYMFVPTHIVTAQSTPPVVPVAPGSEQRAKGLGPLGQYHARQSFCGAGSNQQRQRQPAASGLDLPHR